MIEEYEFQILINPSNLFTDTKEVLDFLELSDNIDELQAFKEKCLEEELYEYCKLIQDKIDYLNEHRIERNS
jgi:hypothetical protein